ncbi:hypothetical protein RBEMOGI_0483 [Rickettsia bellii str. RML Mogi]|uniref:Uncharacterized protein n=1 Tax=Rickettsia bellii str. RML Mogi TaxID=1359194 RepID=A0A0F3QI96_RICBE|nr:hypothetical protein RBEMOGI_0483 [Rickettsia bellii str. RML Mogi]
MGTLNSTIKSTVEVIVLSIFILCANSFTEIL